MSLYTKDMKSVLKDGALRQIKELNQKVQINQPRLIIADIGANIGYFSESFLEIYSECELHAYEPQPDNLNELRKLEDARFTIHEYGLFNSDGEFTIGMRKDGKSNNGTYGIFNKENSISVPFKNANNETIRPHIVKMDVEGAEAHILECEDFFSETKAVLIELVYKDDFGMNKKTEENLKKLGFTYKCHLGKNDQLWLK
jgi:FkbM family methyltransferase